MGQVAKPTSTARPSRKGARKPFPKVEWLSVRDLAEKDVEALIGLGEDIHRESIYRNLDYDPAKLRKLAEAALDRNASMFCCFVAEYKGGIAGVFAGIIAVHYFGLEMSASDMFLYIPKKYRATRIGASATTLLISRYESWARKMGATEITIRAISKGRPRRTHRLFQELGYKEKGILFKKDVDQDS